MQLTKSIGAVPGSISGRAFSGRNVVPSQTQSRGRSRRQLSTRALFGWGNSEEKRLKEQEKEEAYRIQQEVLKRRRQGGWQKDVQDRRAVVRRYNTDPEFKKKVDEEKRERAKANRPPDPELSLFNIVIPLAPFGIPEYDLGERFDLKAKYCDNGWVDEDAAFGKQVARFFGKGKKKGEDDGGQGDKKGRKK